MNESTPLTDDVFAAFLKCRYKAYLKLQGACGEKSDHERVLDRLSAEYRVSARQELIRKHGGGPISEATPCLSAALKDRPPLILDALVSDADEACRLDALEKVRDQAPRARASYRPVLFVRREKVTVDDRLLLAFGAAILTRLQGSPPGTGSIVHGKNYKSSRVELTTLSEVVAQATGQIRALQEGTEPPLLLNRHCPECEFRKKCRDAAVAKDDLSQLRGLSPKEIAALHKRGIFTVVQYSHTFRPARMKRASSTARTRGSSTSCSAG